MEADCCYETTTSKGELLARLPEGVSPLGLTVESQVALLPWLCGSRQHQG